MCMSVYLLNIDRVSNELARRDHWLSRSQAEKWRTMISL